MLRRIIFFTAVLFIAFVVYRIVDKQGSQELLDRIRNFSFSDVKFPGVNLFSSQQEKQQEVEVIDLTQNISPSNAKSPSNLKEQTSTSSSTTAKKTSFPTKSTGSVRTTSQGNAILYKQTEYQTKSATPFSTSCYTCEQKLNQVQQEEKQPTDKQVLEWFANNIEN